MSREAWSWLHCKCLVVSFIECSYFFCLYCCSCLQLSSFLSAKLCHHSMSFKSLVSPTSFHQASQASECDVCPCFQEDEQLFFFFFCHQIYFPPFFCQGQLKLSLTFWKSALHWFTWNKTTISATHFMLNVFSLIAFDRNPSCEVHQEPLSLNLIDPSLQDTLPQCINTRCSQRYSSRWTPNTSFELYS